MKTFENWKFSKSYKHLTTAGATAVVLVLLIFAIVFYLVYFPVYVGNTPIPVVIEDGQGSKVIARSLKEKGIILSETAFLSYVKLTGQDSSLRAGRYNFSGRLDVPEIVSILVNGLSESEDIRLLISEGFNIWEIDERLVSLGLIREGWFSAEYYKDEGYLFPDTYRINRKAEDHNFIQELRQRMADNFNKKTAELLAGLSLAESREIITIASILEKEARSEKDMKLVSGIIRKRLKLGMPLQIDATVIYGACRRIFLEVKNPDAEGSGSRPQRRDCDVTYQSPAAEIKIDGPYNTYTRKGLPPGPISNPGLKAIEAALNPTESDYLYYLSTRDGSQMVYSKTAGEHVANRRKYLGI